MQRFYLNSESSHNLHPPFSSLYAKKPGTVFGTTHICELKFIFKATRNLDVFDQKSVQHYNIVTKALCLVLVTFSSKPYQVAILGDSDSV